MDVVPANVERLQHIFADVGAVFCVEACDSKDPPWIRRRRWMVETNYNLPATAPNNRNAVGNSGARRRRLITPISMI